MSKEIHQLDATMRDLWQLRAWMERHPEVRGDFYGTTFWVNNSVPEEDYRALTASEVAVVVRAMKDLATVKKRAWDDSFEYTAPAKNGKAKVQLMVSRSTVCTAKVVGTREVERPDPEAPKVKVTEDIIEWDCEPILARAEEDLVND